MTSRVLVTGGLGFIGSNLALACRARGAAVTVVDTLHQDCGGNRANLGDAGIPVVAADIRDAAALADQVRGVDAIFHCAALTSHAGSMANPIETAEVNGTGTLTLLEALRQHAPEAAFVHVGTSTQIGRMRTTPIDEAHPEFPLDIYSASKTAAEKYVLVYGTAHALRTTVIRLANIYGPRAHVKTPRFGFMGFFVGLALQGKAITVYGDGSQLRSATYVDDAVAALLAAADRADSRGELVFAAAEQQHRLGHIAERMAAVIGGQVKYIDWPEEKRRLEVGDAVISAARARALLGWQATTDLDAGLAATAAYYRDRLGDYLMKLLVTGALGHIGSSLIHSLQPGRFAEVVLVDNLLTQRYCSLFDLPRGVRFRWVEADIRTADLRALFDGIDVVLHLAAITDAASSFDKPEQVEQVNQQGTERVAAACVATGSKLFFPLTTSVYGVQDAQVDEDCPASDLKPQSPYAVSKLASEEHLLALGCAGTLRSSICRLGTIFGTSIGMRFHTAVNKFCWQASFGQPLTVWRTALNQRRPYLDLSDCVRALDFIIDTDRFDSRVYNVVTANATVADIVDAIRAHIGEVDIEYVDSPIMNELSYDVSAARFRDLGFEFRGDFARGIGATLDLLRSAAGRSAT